MSEETARKAEKAFKERQKKEHLRYLQKKLGRALTAKELIEVRKGKL